jgi:hypothetical protein
MPFLGSPCLVLRVPVVETRVLDNEFSVHHGPTPLACFVWNVARHQARGPIALRKAGVSVLPNLQSNDIDNAAMRLKTQ